MQSSSIEEKGIQWMRLRVRRLGRWCRTREGRVFLGLLTAALLVRGVLAPYHGFDTDLQDYVDWGLVMDRHFWHFYAVASAGNQPFYLIPNYPPLSMYIFGLLDAAYFGLAHLAGQQPAALVTASHALSFVMKLPTIAADLGTIALLYLLARRLFSKRSALLVAAAYAFSPAILFDGALWGQTDSIFTFFLLLALAFATRRQGIWSGIFFGLAIMWKPQPALYAPLLLLYLWRWAGWKEALQSAGSTLATSLVICAPYLLPPDFELAILAKNVGVWASAGHASDGAFNLWWLLGTERSPAQPFLGPLSPTLLGWGVFLLILLLILASIWKDTAPQSLFFGAGLLGLSSFTFLTLQHERYLYPALALFLVAFLHSKQHLPLYLLASSTAFLNMLLVVLIIAPHSGFSLDDWRAIIHSYAPLIGVGMIVVSLTNLGLCLGGVLTLLRGLRRPRSALASGRQSTAEAGIALSGRGRDTNL